MSHFRKIKIQEKIFEYKVGKHQTFVRGVGIFQNCKIGYCHDVSMDKFSVSPRAVKIAITEKLQQKSA